MKKIQTFVLLIVLATLSLGCSKEEPSNEFKIEANSIATVPVTVEEGQSFLFSRFESDAFIFSTEISEIQENFDKIKSVKVNSISFEIKNFNGVSNAILERWVTLVFDSTFSVRPDSSNWNINLEEADNDNLVFSIPDVLYGNKISRYEKIAELFQQSRLINITFNGTLDQEFRTSSFTVEVIVSLTYTFKE